MEPDLSQLFTFAVWMTGDRDQGLERATNVVGAAPTVGFAGWARALLAPLTGPSGEYAHAPDVLSALDETLRTELTITASDHPQIQRDPRRLRVLQWHLKRSCLASVMSSLAVMPRAVFILVEILGFSKEHVGAMLDMLSGTVQVNYSRAWKKLDNYLSVRCQHIAPANSCRCETRLGVALECGFVVWPQHPEESPDLPVSSNAHSNVAALYRSLPGFAMNQSEKSALAGAASA